MLSEASVAETVAIVLHELAHVHQYLVLQEAVIEQPEHETEEDAWIKSAEWAATSELESELATEIEIVAARARLQDGLRELVEEILKGMSYVQAEPSSARPL
jgi:hypothetical protein